MGREQRKLATKIMLRVAAGIGSLVSLPRLVRAGSTLTSLPRHRFVPMPRLSPSMVTGTLTRWVLNVGDEIDDMQVAFEVQTAELTDDPADGVAVLQIEAHEYGYLAKTLLAEGETAAPDEAIAIICDKHEFIPLFADYPVKPRPIVEPATFAWQAYLKSGSARTCS